MQIKTIDCPKCHAPLKVPEGQTEGAINCPYCGTTVYLEPDKPDIYQTINIDEVHIGNEPELKKMSAATIAIVAAAVFVILGVIVHYGRQALYRPVSAAAEAAYRTAPEDPAVQTFVEQALDHPLSELTEKDYERIHYLSIRREEDMASSDPEEKAWIFSWAPEVDDLGNPVDEAAIRIDGTESIAQEDMQVFTGLEALYLNDEADINWQSENGKRDLKNLTHLHYYQGSGYESLEDIAVSIADPSMLYLLRGAQLYDQESADALKQFTGIRYMDITVNADYFRDLSFLSEMGNIEELSLHFSAMPDDDIRWDISYFSALTKLKKLYIYAYGVHLDNITVLNGMPQLESLEIENADDLKSLDFVRNMPRLKFLSIAFCPIISLDGLSNDLALTSLSLEHCAELKNVDALQTLTSLKTLDMADIWNFDLAMPELKGLTALENVSIQADYLESVAGLPSLESVTILETCGGYSMRPLIGMDKLSHLTLRGYQLSPKPDMADCLNQLPSLKELTCDGNVLSDGTDYSAVLSGTGIRKLTIVKDDLGTSCITLSLKNMKNNSQLEELDLCSAEILNLDDPDGSAVSFGQCAKEFLAHYSGIRKLDLSGTQLENLDSIDGMTTLEDLNISDNYVTDVSKLRELPKLSRLICTDNPIANLDVLPDQVEVIQ